MTVTFYPEVGEQKVQVGCPCGNTIDPQVHPTQKDAYNHVYGTGVERNRPHCEDEYCNAFRGVSFIEVATYPTVNVSNINSTEILSLLGWKVGEDFSERCCGVMTAEDFAGRVMLAEAILPVDAGAPPVQEGNLVSCGREEGYLNARLTELREVAEYATANGFNVAWS